MVAFTKLLISKGVVKASERKSRFPQCLKLENFAQAVNVKIEIEWPDWGGFMHLHYRSNPVREVQLWSFFYEHSTMNNLFELHICTSDFTPPHRTILKIVEQKTCVSFSFAGDGKEMILMCSTYFHFISGKSTRCFHAFISMRFS